MEILHPFFTDAKSECDCPDTDDQRTARRYTCGVCECVAIALRTALSRTRLVSGGMLTFHWRTPNDSRPSQQLGSAGRRNRLAVWCRSV